MFKNIPTCSRIATSVRQKTMHPISQHGHTPQSLVCVKGLTKRNCKHELCHFSPPTAHQMQQKYSHSFVHSQHMQGP